MPRRIEYQVEVENNTRRGLNSVDRDVSRTFNRISNETTNRFGGMGRSIAASSRTAATAVATIATAATAAAAGIGVLTAGLGAFIKSQQQAASAIAVQAKEMNISNQRYQQLSHVAKVAGTEVDAFKDAMENLNGKLYDASTGSEDTMEAFKALGISIFNTDGTLKTSAQTLDEVIPRLAELSDEGRRAALADELLSGAAAKLTGVFNMNKRELAELYEQGLKYAVVSERMIALSEENRKAQVILGASFKGLMMTLAEPMMPMFTNGINLATNAIQKLIPIVESVIKKVSDTFDKLRPSISSLTDSLGDSFNSIRPVIARAVNASIAIFDSLVPAVGKVITEVGKLVDAYSDFWRSLDDVGVVDFFASALSFLGDTFIWVANTAIPSIIRGFSIFVKSLEVGTRSIKAWASSLVLTLAEIDQKFTNLAIVKPFVSDEAVAKTEDNLLNARESFHVNFAKMKDSYKDLKDLTQEPLDVAISATGTQPTPKPTKKISLDLDSIKNLNTSLDALDKTIRDVSNKFLDLLDTVSKFYTTIISTTNDASESIEKHLTSLEKVERNTESYIQLQTKLFLSAVTGLGSFEKKANALSKVLNDFSVSGARDMKGLLWNIDLLNEGTESYVDTLIDAIKRQGDLIESLVSQGKLQEGQAELLASQFEENTNIIKDLGKTIRDAPIDRLNEMVEAFKPEAAETFRDKIAEINDEFFNIIDTTKVLRDRGLITEQEYTDRVIELHQIKEDKLAEIEQDITDTHNEEIRKRVNAANASVAESMSILNSTMGDTVGVIKNSLSSLSPDVEQALGVYKAISALSTLNEFLGSNVESMGENILTLKEQFPNGAFQNVLFGGEGSEAFGELIAATSELTNSVFNTMAEVAATSSERSMEKLKEREEGLDDWYNTEKNKLKGSRRNRRFYERDLAKLEEEKAKREEKLLEEQKKAQAEAARKQLGIQLVQAVASTALGIANALTMSPPPLGIAMAAIMGTMGAVQVGLIASQMSKFAQGGIVEGPSVGDQNVVRANGGEMILTRQQQANLFEMAKQGGMGGATVTADMSVTINGSADRETIAAISENQNEKLQLLRDQLEELSYRGELTPIVQGI